MFKIFLTEWTKLTKDIELRKRNATIDQSTRALSTGMATLAHAFTGHPIVARVFTTTGDNAAMETVECDAPPAAKKKMIIESDKEN